MPNKIAELNFAGGLTQQLTAKLDIHTSSPYNLCMVVIRQSGGVLDRGSIPSSPPKGMALVFVF